MQETPNSSSNLKERLAQLSPEARQAILKRLRTNSAPPSHSDAIELPNSPHLHGLFLDSAERRSSFPAVIFGDSTLTYRELKQAALALSNHLNSLGVRPGDCIGIHLTRTEQLPIAVLGILIAGGTAICLDPAYPQARLQRMVSIAKITIILSNHPEQSAFIGPSKIVQLPLLENPKNLNPTLPSPFQNDVALISFTSGSTGDPKAIEVEHRGLVNLMRHFARHRILEEHDIVYAHSSISFDVGIRDILFPLLIGATVVVASDEDRMNLSEFTGVIHQKKITYLNATPTLWRAITQDTRAAGKIKAISSGEHLSQQLSEVLVSRFAQVWNVYGPTEASMLSTFKRIENAAETSIGSPIDGVVCDILTPSLVPVADSEAGELVVSGVGVSRSYLHPPGASNGTFIHLNSKTIGERGLAYRTGDLVKRLPNGELAFLGRIDSQLSYNGSRIEAGELEHLLLQIPQVKQVAFKVFPGTLTQRLVAYLVSNDPKPDIQSLVSHLRASLPHQYSPSDWIFLDELPVTQSGKTDFIRLPHPKICSARETESHQSSTIEDKILALWSELLEAPSINTNANFFFHGGSSLLAMRMLSKIPSLTGAIVEMRKFLKNPTISGLLAEIEASCLNSANQPNREDHNLLSADCSFQQEYFWTLHQLSQAPESLNCRCKVRFEGDLDKETFRSAARLLVQSKAIYRTTYIPFGDKPKAIIHQKPDFSLQFIEPPTSDCSPEVIASLLDANGINEPFDLQHDQPIRLLVIQAKKNVNFVVLCIHHIACDGDSWNLFWRDLVHIYRALAQEVPIPDHLSDHQYSSLIAGQHSRRKTTENALHYWARKLQDLPPFPLDTPQLTPSTDSPPTRIGIYTIIPPEIWKKAQDVARGNSSSLHNFFLSCFFAWQHLNFNASDFVIGTPVNSRAITGDHEVHGCTINVLPIRQHIDGSKTFAQIHESVAKAMIEAIEHHEFPMLELLSSLTTQYQRHERIYHSLFQVRNIHHDWEPFDSRGSALMQPLPGLSLQLPLLLEIFPPKNGQDAILHLAADSQFFQKQQTEEMAASILSSIECAASKPSTALKQTFMIDSDLREKLTNTWAKNTSPYPRNQSIPHRHRKIVHEFPDKVALIEGEKSISYAELDHLTSVRACELASHGVSAGDRVGVMLERSSELIVCTLAILKLGACYVPIDTEYPTERIRVIHDDARLRVILSDHSGVARLRTISISGLDIKLMNPADNPQTQLPDIDASTPAAMIYTSGTTGKPKGVLIPHRGIVRLVVGNNYAELGPEQTFLHHSSPSFDASFFEYFAPLLNGGTLVIMPPGIHSLEEIGDTIQRHQVSTLWLTAGLFHLFIDQAIDILRPLSQVITGGDVLSPKHVRACLDHHPGLSLINGYGPTENTTFSCCYRIPFDYNPEISVPIGSTVANSEAYILDNDLSPCPIGLPGNLWVGGDGLAIGYWERPDLEAERFVQNPFSSNASHRIYSTGDRACLLADGNIRFLHRNDNQVKIRGFRIELNEIENTLRRCSDVHDACVFVTGNSAHSKTLGACIIPKSSAETFKIETVRRELGRLLPAYMLPGTWSTASSLPLTKNGKVDRERLAIENVKNKSGQKIKSRPRNQLEHDLLQIWQRLFQNDQISCTDNFFDIGGNSLLAMRCASEICKVTNRNIPLNTLLKSPTVRSLASAISAACDNLSTVILLRAGNKFPPLFVIHGWGGEVFAFLKFAEKMSSGIPVFGVQAVEHATGEQRLDSIEALGERYARDIIKSNPDGPYYLCGYSLGSLIAFETARHLKKRGKNVAQVFVIDGSTVNITRLLRVTQLATRLSRRLVFHINAITSLSPRELPAYILKRRKAARYLSTLYLTNNRRLNESKSEVKPEAIGDYYQHLFNRYFPPREALPITAFLGEFDYQQKLLVWSHLTKRQATFQRVAREHHDMLNDDEIQKMISNQIINTYLTA